LYYFIKGFYKQYRIMFIYSNRMTKNIFKSKTIWTGIGTILTSVGLLVSGEATLQEFIIGVVGFVFIVLRMVTCTGIREIE